MQLLNPKLLTPLVLALLTLAVTVPQTGAQSIYATPYAFTNFAGLAGAQGYMDDTGSAARFFHPEGLALDSAGNVYVGDENNVIRIITPAGVVTTLAGNPGVPGSADGQGSAAGFYGPDGVAVDSATNVYVADYFNHTIRKIDPAGNVTTLAGSPGVHGSADGQGSAALFYYPYGVAVDKATNVYVVDQFNNTIRKIDPAGNVTTLAGSPNAAGSADGTGSAARFNSPEHVALDAAGNLYVGEFNNDTLRMITPAGVVTTLAGSPGATGSTDGIGSTALFSALQGVAVDSAGDIYVADCNNHRISKGSILRPPILMLSWSVGGKLQSATNVLGPWVDVPNSSSPVIEQPTGPQNFYRVR